LVPEDLAFVARLLGDREVMRFFPKPYSRDEAAEWIRRQRERYATQGHGYWLVAERASGEPVGQAGIVSAEVEGVVELSLGYILERLHWGRGLATEAAAASRDWAFDVLGAPRVITLIRPENLPSLGVARRVGMRLERRTIFAGYEHFVFSLSRAGRPAATIPASGA
jgi:RimJ/RimL family protein N-acetyltransferase